MWILLRISRLILMHGLLNDKKRSVLIEVLRRFAGEFLNVKQFQRIIQYGSESYAKKAEVSELENELREMKFD